MAPRIHAWAFALAGLAVACGGGGGRPPNIYSITGTIEGLGAGDTGLVLQLNGHIEQTIAAAATTFTFENSIADGDNYVVVVKSSPPGLSCDVDGGSGLASGEVSGVKVTCRSTAFHVSGRVRGLARPGLKLALNGQDLPVAANGGVSFPAYVAQGATYAVTVSAQPAPQTCKVRNGTGTMGTAVTDVVVTCTGCAGGFCWENPLPQGNTMLGLWAAASDDVWAVGLAGTILHYDGQAWAQYVSPVTVDLQAVWGSSAEHAWAVGAAGTLLEWDGQAWTARDSGTTQDLMSVWGSGASDVWIVGGQGTALHGDGHGWTSPAATGTTQTLNGVWVAGPGDAWAVANDGAYRWNGTNWIKNDVASLFLPASTSVKMSDVGLNAVWGRSTGDVYFAGGNGFTWHWTGGTFELLAGGGGGPPIVAIWGAGASDVWTLRLGGGGGISSHDSTWTLSDKGFNGVPYPYAITGTSPTDVWVARKAGSMFHWNGAAWKEEAGAWLGTPKTPYASEYGFASLFGSGSDDLWVTGPSYTTAHRAGGEWADGPDTAGRALAGSATDLWMLGADNTLSRRVGSAWSVEASNTTAVLNDLWGSGYNVWAVGKGGVTDRWNGSTWTPGTVGTTADLNAVWGTGADDVWAVGASGSIVHWTGSWAASTSNVQATLYDVWGSSTADVWAVGGGGTIVHFTDGKWSPVSSGTAVDLFGVWGSGPNDVWAVGAKGTVLRWSGKAWSAVPSGTTYDLRAVWGSGAGDVRIAGDWGTILSWTP